MALKTDPFAEKISVLSQTESIQLEEDATYGQALDTLRQKKNGAIVVCRKGKAAGILTERDILNKCILENMDQKTKLAKLMTPGPVTVRPDISVREAIRIMHTRHVRNLPIVDASGRPVGLLTVGRVIRHLAAHFPAEVVNLPPKPEQVSEEVEGA